MDTYSHLQKAVRSLRNLIWACVSRRARRDTATQANGVEQGMSTSTSNHDNNPRRRRKSPKIDHTPSADGQGMPRSPRAQTTSLESISIQPRTPKTASARVNGVPGWQADDASAVDEVELSLLGEEERREAAEGLTLEEEQEYLSQTVAKKAMSAKDKRAIALLIILCQSLSFGVHVSCE